MYIKNTDNKLVSVRDIAEDHVKEDCQGRIPTIDDWLSELPPKDWMVGRGLKKYIDSINMEAD